MKYHHTLLVAACLLIVGCSSQAETSFEKIVVRVDKFFAGQPSLLTSTRIVEDGQQAYAYYTLKVDKCTLSYDVKNTYSTSSPYIAFISLSCEASDNIKSGDLVRDTSEFRVTSEVSKSEASGFSTTSMALANNDFSSNHKPVTFLIRYSYQNSTWACTSVTAGGAPKSLIRDLESFPQNKSFREAVGISE